MMRHIAAVLTLVICALCAADDEVLMRGGKPSLRGELTFDEAGVTVRQGVGGDATQFVPWDRVREVRMFDEHPLLADYMRTAEELWRARSRLQRGDAGMAEPLFERLFERYRGSTHETALIVAEGLLRCRIERQDLSRAVVPALEAARLRRQRIVTDRYHELVPVFDEASSLCIYLPPVWIDERAAERLAGELARYDARGDEVVAALAELYRATTQTLEFEPSFDRETNRHSGVRLLRDLVGTKCTDAARREVARGRLVRDMRDHAPWAEAWARYFVGASLLAEDDASQKDVGALQLTHLPARFSQQQPYLAGMAIARLIDMSHSGGNTEAAQSLRMELARRYAYHPVRRITH